MKIAVLAWGSLLWNRGPLSIRGDFVPSGPRLPIEFCRISADGRLTLVIDEHAGHSCLTYVATSAFESLEIAKENLRDRERMNHIEAVGFVDAISGAASEGAKERHLEAVEVIRNWTAANGYDATFWTALPGNFAQPDKGNAPFSIKAAIAYLEQCDEMTFRQAIEYIRKAPPETQTPLRAAVDVRWPPPAASR